MSLFVGISLFSYFLKVSTGCGFCEFLLTTMPEEYSSFEVPMKRNFIIRIAAFA